MPILAINISPSPGGTKSDITVYPKGRRCKLCRKLLSIYTPGPYCLVHGFKGAVMDMEEEERRVEKERVAHKKMMEKRARLRREWKK